MRLDDDAVRAAYACAAESLRNRVNQNVPVPFWLQSLYGRLDLEVRLSRTRQETDWDGEESEEKDSRWIGSPEAAAILGWSTRKVQRLAPDLDGQLTAGRWLFRESAVTDYAEAMRDGRWAFWKQPSKTPWRNCLTVNGTPW